MRTRPRTARARTLTPSWPPPARPAPGARPHHHCHCCCCHHHRRHCRCCCHRWRCRRPRAAPAAGSTAAGTAGAAGPGPGRFPAGAAAASCASQRAARVGRQLAGSTVRLGAEAGAQHTTQRTWDRASSAAQPQQAKLCHAPPSPPALPDPRCSSQPQHCPHPHPRSTRPTPPTTHHSWLRAPARACVPMSTAWRSRCHASRCSSAACSSATLLPSSTPGGVDRRMQRRPGCACVRQEREREGRTRLVLEAAPGATHARGRAARAAQRRGWPF